MKIVPLKAWLQLLDKAKNEKLAQMRPNLTMHFEASRLILKSIHTHTHTHTHTHGTHLMITLHRDIAHVMEAIYISTLKGHKINNINHLKC